MRMKLVNLLDAVGASYWFIPSMMGLGAFLLSYVTLTLDQRFGPRLLSQLPFIYLSQPDGARSFLSTVAGAMLGVAGVAFSILMVVLPMTSGQFGPRLLSNFMRDRGSQTVLGTFIATFLYCLLILRTVRGESSTLAADAFVPQLSLIAALLVAIVGLGMFIYFIHHTAESIQVSYMLTQVSRKLRKRILHDRPAPPYPAPLGHGPGPAQAEPALPPDFRELSLPLAAARGDYLRSIEEDRLLRTADDAELVIELCRRPGDFVLQGSPLAYVYPGSRLASLEDELGACFNLGTRRGPLQDLEFLFDELTEVALRALPPSTNDPYTAMHCADRIADNLSLLASREPPSPYRFGESGKLRVVAPGLEPAALVPHLFGPIRAYGASDFMLLDHLLETFGDMAALVPDASFRGALRSEAERVREHGEASLSAGDRERLLERYGRLQHRLGEVAG